MSKTLLKNIKTLFQVGENFPSRISGKNMKNLPSIDNAFLALEDGEILGYGKMQDWEGITDWQDLEIIDCENQYVLPAFIDSHSHAVFAKYREDEFVDRINGLSYEEIAAKGGGILNSARKLHLASEDELFHDAKIRIEEMMQFGTGALEIKSGYGLSVEGELKMLRVIKRLKEAMPIAIKATFLGAHALPEAFTKDRKGYLDLLTTKLLPVIAEEKLADFIDVFCERNYFTVDDMATVIEAGKKYGLEAKVHVNQFSILGAVQKAVDLSARSVDHLEESDDKDLEALKNSKTIPVFLPACSHFLSIPYGNVRAFIDADIPIALASDFNPGSTPCKNIQFVFSLACVKMKLTPEEAINGLTQNGAYAMGLEKTHGSISIGKKTPVILTKKIPSLAYIPYAFGENHVDRLIF